MRPTGLQQEIFGADNCCSFKILGRFKRATIHAEVLSLVYYNSRVKFDDEPDMETHVLVLDSFIRGTSEAVDNTTSSAVSSAPILTEAFFAKNLYEVCMRSSRVKKQGEVVLLRKRKLGA